MRLWHRATLSKQGTSGGVPRFDMAPAVLASRAKGGQVRTKVANASGRHMPTYDSCLVTLTGLVLRVLPRLALRVRTRATYACLASTCWLSITLGALLSADTAGSHFYGGNTADGRRESALCFTAVSQAQRRSACLRTRRGLAGDECGLQQRTYRSGWPRVGSLRHRPRRRHRNRPAPLSRCHLWRRSQRCSPSSLQCILDRWWVRAATLYLLRAR